MTLLPSVRPASLRGCLQASYSTLEQWNGQEVGNQISFAGPPVKYDDILQPEYLARSELDVPDGKLWLRLAVHDVSADRVGSIQFPLKILAKKTE
jgi:hypothetical protein